MHPIPIASELSTLHPSNISGKKNPKIPRMPAVAAPRITPPGIRFRVLLLDIIKLVTPQSIKILAPMTSIAQCPTSTEINIFVTRASQLSKISPI